MVQHSHVTSAPLLSVTDLHVRFQLAGRVVEAVRGVSFDVQRNSILGIVGGSGSGKSVACRSLMRLLPENARVLSGRIDFDGIDVLQASETELDEIRGERIAMIFQNPSTHLNPIMPVGRQIGETLVKHRGISAEQARREAIALLEEMSIPNPGRNIDAYPHELSGGMRQRVMIAAALACRPDVLIADEPTTALDVTVQASILALLKRLRREWNLTIILVSHDLGVIAEMCDRMVVMQHGELVEEGTVDEVIGSPRSPYTERLIASQPALLAAKWFPDAASAQVSSDQPAQPSLVLQDVRVAYGRPPSLLSRLTGRVPRQYNAVRSIDLEIERYDTLGIVGESGSGKSTVAKAIAGLVPVSSGRISFKGHAVDGLKRDDLIAYRRQVQMVFQDPYTSLNPLFTVAQTLAEPMRIHRLCPLAQIDGRVDDLMRRVDLDPELRYRRPSQLSGGQRQRVGIARALALEPELLVADEVTSALDVTVQAQIIGLFARLHRELGLSLILISHDLAVVRCLCRRVVVMKSGEIVETGWTQEVFDKPQHPYTRELIRSIPDVARGRQ